MIILSVILGKKQIIKRISNFLKFLRALWIPLSECKQLNFNILFYIAIILINIQIFKVSFIKYIHLNSLYCYFITAKMLQFSKSTELEKSYTGKYNYTKY